MLDQPHGTAADAIEQGPAPPEHGGKLIARRLKLAGVSKLFTLSGGHIFPVFDGCREQGIEIVDVRHEQAAAFAAEGWAKVTREPGVCALTAGPGVTNGMSAISAALSNNSPTLVLGGRAPAARWGSGSLQEIDHIPFVRPLTRFAATADSTQEIPDLIDRALEHAVGPPGGPSFVDLPMDHLFMEAPPVERELVLHDSTSMPPADQALIDRAIELLAAAQRPVVMAGTNLYWGRAENALRAFAEEMSIPVFLNGLGRGCLPADHPNFFSRARGNALKGADCALVIGVPLDFRLGFGHSFGEETELIYLDMAEPPTRGQRELAVEMYGGLVTTLEAIRQGCGDHQDDGVTCERGRWLALLRNSETESRAAETAELTDDRAPLHPMRIYAELKPMLERDAVIICDGGDFVSYAGKMIDTYKPGCWMDPGPFGCLGSGPGYALAAKLARPDSQVVMLMGDGAFGFSGMEFDTLIRHNIPVVAVIGNNGIWGLEKHPMEFLYGYSVAADLRPGTRYDQVVSSLGGHGEFVEKPEELRPALERAFAAGKPAVVNVMMDPAVMYPRKANLA